MKVLVIGGTRFMGPYLVERLHSAGHEVVLFHREHCDQGAVHPDVRHLHGDRRHLPTHRAELIRLAPDVVIDMVCMTATDAHQLMNVFTGVAGRLVVASSMDVYLAYGRLLGDEPGEPVSGPFTEDAPLRTRRWLRRAHPPRDAADPDCWKDDYEKLDVEPIVLGSASLAGSVVRLPMVYGPGDFQHRVREYLAPMDAGRPAIVLDGAQAAWRGARGYVENMAAALALVATDARAAGRTYNVADQPALSERDWVGAIARAAGWAGRLHQAASDKLPEALAPGFDTRQDWAIDDRRIRHELGYQPPISLAEGLARSVAWERAHPADLATVEAMQLRFAAEDEFLSSALDTRR